MHLSRRQFGLAGLLLAAPFAAMLGGRRVSAGPATKTAKRVVFFFTPDGTVPNRYWPVLGKGGEGEFTFAPGSILEPLATQRDRLLILDGLEFEGFDNHEPGMRGMLTGMGAAGSPTQGASVDQYLARAIGSATRFPSLELGVMTADYGSNTQTRMSYARAGVFAPPEDDPTSAFTRLFGDVAGDPAATARLLARRKSILDLQRSELALLRARVGVKERAKLDQHLEALRDVERGLGGTGGACAAPVLGAAVSPYSQADFPAIGKSQLDVLVAALSCDLTRVASLQWSHTVSPVVFSWLGLGETHHELSHKGDGDTAGVASFVKAERWYAERFAELLTRLVNTPDPAGGTLYDSTLVVWCKELADGRLHDAKRVPFVLAGGASGAIRTGRYLDYGGVTHQKLLVSICSLMGVGVEAFGDSTRDAGGLERLS